MSLAGFLTNVVLPPPGLVLAALFAAVLAWALARRGRRWASGLAVAALAGYLLLSTSLAADLLVLSLQRELAAWPAPSMPPEAIVILGAEIAHTPDGPDVGPLTLERLRAGVALQRRTGLPILVTGGPIGREREPIAALMARSLREDFGTAARWVEPRSRDTWENAAFSADMLREAGIHSAWLVTHAWHLPRALAVFERRGLPVAPAPVRLDSGPGWTLPDLVPRADFAAMSWYAIREWVGRAVYRFRG